MILFAGLFLTGAVYGDDTAATLRKVENRNHVCMVNDMEMGKPQIPVQVGDKIYYGCCEGCTGALKNDRSARYSKDPATGREVDKAKAFITSNQDGTVLYFESEETARKYHASISQMKKSFQNGKGSGASDGQQSNRRRNAHH